MIEFFIAKKHILERKKQSIISILGIVIGITVLTVSIAISNGLNNNMINIYINTPGGSIFAGLSIYDISKYIKSPIRTVALGSACSMGAILLLMGQERCALKHTRIMFHQPSGGAFGTSDDIKVTHELIETLKANLYKIVEENTLLKNVEQIFKLDTWYNSKQALDNGIITKIL